MEEVTLASHHTTEFPELKNLLPREAYDQDETSYWKRLSIFLGITFGFIFAALMYFGERTVPNIQRVPTVGETVLVGVIAGLLFGTVFPRRFRRRLRDRTDRLFAADGGLIGPPPTPDAIVATLLCTWRKGVLGVGGVMYIGAAGLEFVPNRDELKSIDGFRMAPLTDLHIVVAEAMESKNLLFRILIPEPKPLMQIRWQSGTALFMVPSIEATVERLTQVIRGLEG
jgi:hypothetical protein